MNIVRKDIDQLNATLTIEIVPADYAEKVEKTLRDYRKKANIPGFRPGMVPFGMVKKMYGKAVLGEEINKIISDSLYDYIKTQDLNILGEPLPNLTDQKEIDFDHEDTFEFVFDIALAPAFDVKPTDKDEVTMYDIEVTPEMIDNQVDSFASRFGQYIQENVVEENDVLKGDLVELVDGEAKTDGLTVVDATLSPMHIKDDVQKQLFIGAEKGAKVVFNPSVALPNEAELRSLLKITKEEVATYTSEFCFEIKGITRYKKSKINQELFDKVYGAGNVADEATFRTKVEAGIKENLQQDAAYKFGLDAKEMTLKKMDSLVFPDEFLKRWILTTNEKMTEEALETDYPKMIEELKWHLAKDQIAKANNIKVERTEVEDYAKLMTKMQFAQYGLTGVDDSIVDNYAQEMLKKEDQIKGIYERVVENKVFDVIKAAAKLNNQTISLENFNKLFEVK